MWSLGINERSSMPADRTARPEGGSPKADTLIYRPKPKVDPRARLFCFPYAGAGAAIFRLWPDHLPGDVEVVSLHPPGRAHRLREPPLTRVEAMVGVAVDSFRDLLDRPFAVFGHSLGAVTAAEFVRVTSEAGQQAAHLFVSSRPPFPPRMRQLHKLADKDFVSAIVERYQGIPSEILAHADLLELLLPALRADIEALEMFNFNDRAKIGCPTSVFGGDADPTISPADLEAWRNEVLGPCDVRVFAGDHFYLNTQAKALLAEISTTLKQL
jgi:medium-chain acyl-[acyl-carrier-protein] hydrolase